MKVTSIAGMIGCIGGLSILLFTTYQPSPSSQRPSLSEAKTQVVATVGSRSITLAEVEQAVALRLYQAEEQRVKLLNESIQHLIEEELLGAEATRIGITVPELIERASESEAIAKLADLPSPVRRAQQPSQKQTLSPSSQTPEEVSRIRQALLVQLRRHTTIHVNLPQPELPVLNVSSDDDPWTGAAQAPVTIVEFSDFECPYCRRSVPVLKELLEKYPGKLKLVYRDFPGPNHQQALTAAQAAQCAAEQSRFWEYHDALFTQQVPTTGWDFSALAEDLGLHQSPFEACMKENRYRDEVLKDLRDGLQLGVTSTPTFFINGRPLVGARPLADFQTIIDPLLSTRSSS